MTGPVAVRALQRRAALWLMVGSGCLLVVLANLHLVYVAVTSQPACVGEGKATKGGFGAAQRVCSRRNEENASQG
jgi:hypothetical protein